MTVHTPPQSTAELSQLPEDNLRKLREFVSRQVAYLQQRYLSDRKPDAVATLARLRRGIGKEVGALPELWEIVFDRFPIPADPYVEATYDERAAYTAITLYALHQQSRREPMHRGEQRFGAAVRQLRQLKEQPGRKETAVRRRFEALGTATTFPEIVHHARGLIAQLRGANIPLDYGSFAVDLRLLQTPRGAHRVRLAWGRDFYRRGTHDSPDSA